MTTPPTPDELAEWRRVLMLDRRLWPREALRLLDALEAAEAETHHMTNAYIELSNVMLGYKAQRDAALDKLTRTREALAAMYQEWYTDGIKLHDLPARLRAVLDDGTDEQEPRTEWQDVEET